MCASAWERTANDAIIPPHPTPPHPPTPPPLVYDVVFSVMSKTDNSGGPLRCPAPKTWNPKQIQKSWSHDKPLAPAWYTYAYLHRPLQKKSRRQDTWRFEIWCFSYFIHGSPQFNSRLGFINPGIQGWHYIIAILAIPIMDCGWSFSIGQFSFIPDSTMLGS